MIVGHRPPRLWRLSIVALLLLMAVGLPGGPTLGQRGPVTAAGVASPTSPAGAAGTPAATPAGGTPEVGSTPTSAPATPAAAGTPVGTPAAGSICAGPCLVRFAAGPAVDSALAQSGLRSSYTTGTAVWVGGTPADLSFLIDGGIEPQIVLDKTPSLMLYAVTRAAGSADSSPIDAFGTVLDRDGQTSIVAVPSVPAYVADLTGAGFQVEKLTPYVPARTPLLTPESIASLPDVSELTESFPNLSVANAEETVQDLASTGVGPSELGSRFFALPGNSIAAEYLYLRYAEYGLKVWFEDYLASNGMLSINVVAEIPGTEPGQLYAAFAHYDSISDDVADNDTAPGALDNGTGLAVLLENARVLSGYRLHASMRFVALDGEEVGLQGANAFGARHAELGTPFLGGINVDAVGTAYGQRVLYVNASDSSAFIQDVMLEQYETFGFELNVQPRQNPLIVADETPLTEYGIPTILVGSMLYGDPLINCTCDTIDGVDFDYVRATGRLVMMTFAVLLAPPA